LGSCRPRSDEPLFTQVDPGTYMKCLELALKGTPRVFSPDTGRVTPWIDTPRFRTVVLKQSAVCAVS
jgi:hypothetical protein